MIEMQDQYENIIKWIGQRITQHEIAKRLGVSVSTVNYHVKKLKLQGRLVIPKKVDDKKEKIIKMLDEGKTRKEIAKELNISESTLCRKIKVLRENGSVPDPRKKKNEQIAIWYNNGVSQKEIAQKLDITVTAVRYHLNKMRANGKLYVKNIQDENLEKAKEYSEEELQQLEKEAKEYGYPEEKSRFLIDQYIKKGMYGKGMEVLNDFSKDRRLSQSQKVNIEELKMIIVNLKDKSIKRPAKKTKAIREEER